jgi:hypothetical protein
MYTRQMNFIQQSQCLQKKVHDIAETLGRTPTTQSKFHVLTHELDETLRVLNTVKEQFSSPFAQASTHALEEEIITLYGRVVDAWVHNEVIEIYEEATSLELSLKCGKVTAGAVQRLATRLSAFQKAHRPSLEERRLIADAERILHRADAFLKNDYIEEPHTEACAQNSTDVINDVILGTMEELMDLASLVYNHNKREAKIRYHQLPEALKKTFKAHMQKLEATPFEDVVDTCRAFMAMASECVGNPEEYLSDAELEEFFTELAQVNLEETKDSDNIFSFRSIGSLGA